MIMRYALGHFPTTSHVCHLTTIHEEEPLEENVKVHSIKQIEKDWQQYSENNKGTNMAGQTFYYSFLSLMNIPEAKNVLQVGCGFGNLMPLAIMLKNQKATYLATDLVENMVSNAKKNLQQNFLKYESKLSFQEWCQKHHLFFQAANGQEIISSSLKFDRIICNCVLMITENPQKMLKSFYDQAQSGCLLGVSVWGDREKNPLMNVFAEIMEEQNHGQKLRTQFHLYKKVPKLAQKIGWKLLLQWQQNALIPIFDIKSKQKAFSKTLDFLTNELPEQKRESARNRIIKKATQLIDNKQGLNFSTQLYLFRKQ